LPRIRGGLLPQKRRLIAPRPRHGGKHMRQEGRLVTPIARSRPQIPRQQIRTIGFDQQALGGDIAHQLQQMRAAALIADPAGNPDVQPQIQVSVKRSAIAREAVHYGVAQQIAARPDHRQKTCVGVPFMQKQRQAGAPRMFQVPFKHPLLLAAGREIAKEIQARFPDRHHLGRGP